ncbi:alpha/beta fold hydrolase [Streptomyces sp. NPDC052496]|uniref:thioesterase II family protein n=1 Tax=Streptomyces sp. NPDC052496 TaxID=3154951 RepID=UPI0034469420
MDLELTFSNLRPREQTGGIRPPGPVFTCFFIHHAGGSATAFSPFARHLPQTWELYAVDLPGRGRTAGDPPCRSATGAAAFLRPGILARASGAYGIFGHSMGALVTYELARELAVSARPPTWLGLSGSAAPQLVHDLHTERRDLWPTTELVGFLRDLGGTPEEMLTDPDMAAYLVEVLRGDIAIVDTYTYTPGPAMGIPASIHYGDTDPLVTHEHITPWRKHFHARVDTQSWPGGHFYLFDQAQKLSQHIVTDVERALAAAASSAPREGERVHSV